MKRHVILTPFAEAQVVAAVLAMRGVEAFAVPSSAGVLVVVDEDAAEFGEWDISELLGEDPESAEGREPTAAEAAASALSELSDYGVVVMVAELGDDVGSEPGVSGMVKAHRVNAGERGEDLSAGQLINNLPDEVEDLLIGADVRAVPDAIDTADLGPTEIQEILDALGRGNS
ncbi:hypothetical protein J2S49_001812 [Arcanobacterium wilhelmae]|uniref:Uncharacterized protein n=1 Tax=Arcanobacterium wilhelmae TaxID=1803177 RepID=A0ABT9NED1_9ACTO|nr:hypothetical protein [Arcanobacterium wilhelmae]MDP9801736.1 hypothetical protein [Arcanobacterium wilhelmae]WFN91052.1 hypothetical protein P8A24_04160 [Arcanobacterium wilhelmae]